MSVSNFIILSEIGKGSFGSVYKVKRKIDNEIYAMKKVHLAYLSEKEIQNALNEIRILASINHQNIISYKEAFYSDYDKSIYLITDIIIDYLFQNNILK